MSPLRDDGKPDASLLIMPRNSVQAQVCVDMTYRSDREEITRRIVEPCGLVRHRGNWYLVGWCRLRADLDFRACAMRQVDARPVNGRLSIVFKASMARVRERIPSSLGALAETPEGVSFEWPTDDLCYAARYVVERAIPFVVKEPPELRTGAAQAG